MHDNDIQYDSELPVLGFRRWKLKGPRMMMPEHSLVGSWRETVWPVDEPIQAKCLPYSHHHACNSGPLSHNAGCKCGLHLWYSMSDAQSYSVTNGELGHVVGIAAGGGRVLFDTRYARCEVAEVVCLIDPIEYGPQLFTRRDHRVDDDAPHKSRFKNVDETERIREWADKAAERYGVPMYSLENAVAYAFDLGVFVSEIRDMPDGEVRVEGVDE